jgi:hypothetical protein
VASASAATPDAQGEWGPAPVPPPSVAPALLLLFGLGAAAGIRFRRAAALGLVALAVVFVADSAVHSVHHLGQPQKAEACQVFSLVQHLAWDETPAPAAPVAVGDAGPLVAGAAAPSPATPVLRLDQGRAPPVLAA